MSSEQRQDIRKRTFLKGRILFNKGASSMDCLVRDMSETGARLELSETSTLPEVFDLYIPQKDETFRATLRWRRDGGVGIAFAEHPAKPAAADPAPMPDASITVLLRRIAELEAENAALRSVLTTLSAGKASAA
ncbi:PilZ domain-containing protein [Methylorubrum salsuginis]|uniref:PilZ domain-containing protein n=1 Tax=Methylorubrum salsuginis TaxID=414703 RepID=A0A1I4KVC6_9HYPH|nr:PilZ domain-containing protein [Methylorubrum salsuginis]SFL82561.1 PilZ domain-containing protein [Methylorubrum salsuginis]